MDANIGRFISKKSIRQSNLNVLLTLFQISRRFDFSRCIVFILHLDIYILFLVYSKICVSKNQND